MTFFPLPGTYVVAELDVEKTLASLSDPLANAAASTIKPTKCIVYLNFVLSLPFPDAATWKYIAGVVGPGLRPEDPAECLTRDMCVPIFPASAFGDRAPLQPHTGPFPFGNCYHWFGGGTALDLRVVNDGQMFPAEKRVSLPAHEQVRLEKLRSGDDLWAYEVWKAREEANADSLATPEEEAMAQEDPPLSPIDEAQDDESITPSYLTHWQSVQELEDEPESSPSNDAAPGGVPSNDLSEGVALIDIFGLDEDEGKDLLPVIKIWPDVGAQFKADADVPDPMEFLKQCDEIVRIMKESRARSKVFHAAGRARDSEKGGREQGILARMRSALCHGALPRA